MLWTILNQVNLAAVWVAYFLCQNVLFLDEENLEQIQQFVSINVYSENCFAPDIIH